MSEDPVIRAVLAKEFLTTDWKHWEDLTRAVAFAREHYAEFVRFYCGPPDEAVPLVLAARDFDELFKIAKIERTIVPDTWDGWQDLWDRLKITRRQVKGNFTGVSRRHNAIAQSLLASEPAEAWLNDLAREGLEDCHAALLAYASGRGPLSPGR